jgi:hypothetical protein
VISDTDNEAEDLFEIYQMSMKFGLYDFGKFKARLTALRKKIHQLNDRAAEDLLAFENYKSNHEVSLFTHKGFIQWLGSDAQALLKEEISFGKHLEMTPLQLRLSRSEYNDEFPPDALHSKIKIHQELRTAKYLFRLKEKGLGKNLIYVAIFCFVHIIFDFPFFVERRWYGGRTLGSSPLFIPSISWRRFCKPRSVCSEVSKVRFPSEVSTQSASS